MFDNVLSHRSGRVIALGRALLAAVFLIAIWLDPTQPVQAASITFALLGLYVVSSVGIATATWNNWWLDAKLAAPAHLLDMVAFTLLVYATNGYTSPFFVFFVFLILSAAIRWGWRETTLTAVAVILLFLAAGFIVGLSEGFSHDSASFDLQRFIVRSAHLVILSAILIWFGVNQGFSGLDLPRGAVLPDPSLEDSPLATALVGAIELTGATTALFLWRRPNAREVILAYIRGGKPYAQNVKARTTRPQLGERPLRNRDIAERLGVTEGTVKVYLHSVFEKTGVANRTELAIRAPDLIGGQGGSGRR